jgi:hypothetical protein
VSEEQRKASAAELLTGLSYLEHEWAKDHGGSRISPFVQRCVKDLGEYVRSILKVDDDEPVTWEQIVAIPGISIERGTYCDVAGLYDVQDPNHGGRGKFIVQRISASDITIRLDFWCYQSLLRNPTWHQLRCAAKSINVDLKKLLQGIPLPTPNEVAQ